MTTSKNPDAVLREMVDALFAHANARGIRLKVDIRWPDGLRCSQRTFTEREKRQAEDREREP